MVQTKKKFKKIVLGDENDSWRRESIGKDIVESLNSGKLFTLDTELLLNSCSINSNKKKNSDNNKGKCKYYSLNSNNVKNNKCEKPLKKISNDNQDELDIWGDSIPNLDNFNSRLSYPGELIRSKGPSIKLPHSGQSINPLESDRQDAVFKSSSVSNANTLSNSKYFSTSLIDSFISNYYEPEQVLGLTELQKYHLVNSLLNGEVLKLDSIANLEIVKDFQAEEDKISCFSRQKNGIRKKKSEINREIRKKKESFLNKEKAIIKKLNKDVQNIGKLNV